MRLAAAIAIILTIASCDNRQSAGPLPRAYPRAHLYADTYTAAHLAGLSFDINSSADARSPRPGWLDIHYPRYNATIHITARHLSTPDSIAAAIDARNERMALNLGDTYGEMTDFANSAGFRCRIITTEGGAPIPVQILAVKENGALLSGTAVLHGAAQPADSVSPIVKALEKDALTILRSLR